MWGGELSLYMASFGGWLHDMSSPDWTATDQLPWEICNIKKNSLNEFWDFYHGTNVGANSPKVNWLSGPT